MIGFVLFVYSVLSLIYFSRTAGGITGVGIENYGYVAFFKDRLPSNISRDEYLMLSNHVVRTFTAWIGMLAWFSLTE